MVVARTAEARRVLQAAARRAARSSASTSRSSRGARRRGPGRSKRRSAATRACARAWRSAARGRAKRAHTSRSSGRCATPRCCDCGWTPAGPTRSACTCAIGHPVVGDPEYGRAGLLGLERQFLHATRLAFAHPFTGARDRDLSALPADLARRARARASGYPDESSLTSTRAVGGRGACPAACRVRGLFARLTARPQARSTP